MIKHFCDRCGERVYEGKEGRTSLVSNIPGPKDYYPWIVESKITNNSRTWSLCQPCTDEIMDLFYKTILLMREQRDKTPQPPDTAPF